MRRLLLILHLVVGLNASGGGYYGLSGAPNVPLDWLNGSPFSDYFAPSLVLLFVIGGAHFWAALALGMRQRNSFSISAAAGVILFLWIFVQVLIIGYVSWLQPTMALVSVFILAMAGLCSKKNQKIGEVLK